MSEAGLGATLYGEIRELSELVDAVIADLSNEPASSTLARVELARILRELTATGPSIHLLRFATPGSEGMVREWSALPEILDQQPAPIGLVERLEALARVLERSRSVAFGRLRGIGA